MAYIDYTYYTETFKGAAMSEDDFVRLSDITGDLIYAICTFKPEGAILTNEIFLKANGYQVEFLYEQGGTEAIMGRSDASQSGGSEHLGNYSVSAGNGKKSEIKTYNGIPISSMAIMLLSELGLLSRWVYANRYRGVINGLA